MKVNILKTGGREAFYWTASLSIFWPCALCHYWKTVRWQSVAPVSFKYSWILQGGVFSCLKKIKEGRWWIHLWIKGYLGLVDLRKCILIPHKPPGSLCSPALGTPRIAMKVGLRLAEWLSRAAASRFVSNLGCLGPTPEVSRFSELLWPLPL